MAILTSDLFKGDARLEAAAVSDPAHIVRGAFGDHVGKIQTALNRVDEAGLQIDGRYGSETASAVLSFKRKRDIVARPRQQQADDIVGIRTIKVLDEEMRQWELAPPKPVFANVASPHPMFGDTDRFGFSLARLAKAADGDWRWRNPRLPACQMVPLGATRVLVFKLSGGQGEVNFEFNGPGVCAIVRSSSHEAADGGQEISVTVRGLVPAETELSLRLDLKRVVTVKLIVRSPKQRSLSVVHLGPVVTPGDDAYVHNHLMPVLNWIFNPQVNLTLTPGWRRIQEKLPLNGNAGARWTAPDPKKELYVLWEREQAPKGAAFIHWRDLRQFGQDADLLVFVGPNLKDVSGPNVRGVGPYNTGRCWVNIGGQYGKFSPWAAVSIVAAHEIAHSMGAHHILAPLNNNYLMASPGGFGHVSIPSDTLIDYRIA